jgi:hypothetical protein
MVNATEPLLVNIGFLESLGVKLSQPLAAFLDPNRGGQRFARHRMVVNRASNLTLATIRADLDESFRTCGS